VRRAQWSLVDDQIVGRKFSGRIRRVNHVDVRTSPDQPRSSDSTISSIETGTSEHANSFTVTRSKKSLRFECDSGASEFDQ
jgi:hypothetical protein